MKKSIGTLTDVEKLVKTLHKTHIIAFDVETTGFDWFTDAAIGVSFANAEHAWYVDFLCLEENNESPAAALRILTPLFNLTKHILVAHNAKFDYGWVLRAYTRAGQPNPFVVEKNLWDSMAAAAFNDENLIGVKVDFEDEESGGIRTKKVGCLSLKALSRIYLGRAQRLYQESFAEWTAKERASYACADARNTYDLMLRLRRALKSKRLWTYYKQLIAPLTFVTYHMEQRGILVDTAALRRIQARLQEKINIVIEELVEIVPPTRTLKFRAPTGLQRKALTVYLYKTGWDLPLTPTGKMAINAKTLAELFEKYPEDRQLFQYATTIETPFNPNSRLQLAAYLINQGYELDKTPSGQPQVQEETLKALAEQYPDDPIWVPLLALRHLVKLQSTYVTGVLDVVWEEDGRCHPNWNHVGTVTGRYSSSTSKKLAHPRGPAFQTIPRPDTIQEQGWDFNPREVYIAPAGHKLVVADLSQAEVRMLAVMSGDKDLVAAIQGGKDIHTTIAARIYSEEWAAGNEEQRYVLRRDAKTVVFGTMYGIGPYSLAKELRKHRQAENLDDLTRRAKEVLTSFYSVFPGVDSWKRKIHNQVLRFGYAKTFMGRRRSPILLRPYPRVTAKKGTDRYEQERLDFVWWKTAWIAAHYKSHFDPENTTQQEREQRAVRQAVNSTLQGSVAEMVNYGMLRLHKLGWKIIGQAHDEVIIEVRDDPYVIEAVVSDLKQMWDVSLPTKSDPTVLVPFKVVIGIGDSWAAKV